MARNRNRGQPRSERSRLADMSLPPEQRGRRGGGKRRRKRIGGTPPAQLDHASNAKGRKRQQEGEARMEQERNR